MAIPINCSPAEKKQKNFDPNLCLLCQEKVKLSFVFNPKSDSLNKIKEASSLRKDEISNIIDSKSPESVFKWHRNCYASYVSTSNITRKTKRDISDQKHEQDEVSNTPSSSSLSLSTRRSIIPKCNYKKCIFCQQDTKKKIKKTYRISEEEPAKRLLCLCRERQDEVFVRLSTLNDTKDVFAADILYHKLCLSLYFKESSPEESKYEMPNTIETFEQNIIPTPAITTVETAFARLISEIDEELETNCFELSKLTNRLRTLSTGLNVTVDNRLVKRLLVDHYGDELVFSQPNNKSKSAIVFKASTKSTDLVESIRSIYEKSLNTEILKDSLKSNSFNMKGYVCSDALISEELDNFEMPTQWESFFMKLLGSDRADNKDTKRKCFSIYMDLYYLITDGDLTPKHVALAQSIHHYTRSKFLITTLNKLGHCISYPTLKKIDNQAAMDLIIKNQTETVPLPSNIARDPELFLHGAVDNDDFSEETIDGKNTTHVTAMVLYQTATDPCSFSHQIERTPVPKDVRLTNELIPCQTIKKCYGVKTKPEYYPEKIDIHTNKIQPNEEQRHNEKEQRTEEQQANEEQRPNEEQLPNEEQRPNEAEPTNEQKCMSNFIWCLSRMDHSLVDDKKVSNPALCPGWTPFHQIISKSDLPNTNIGFCALLPAPPTTTDAVYTVMKNFMSINEYVGRKYSVLSCDMAIYLIAKLIQIQKQEFDTLILRIGSFHLAKNWLGVIGQFVHDSGFSDIFIETEIFGENTLKAILKGVHYNRGVRAHKLMYEACRRIQLQLFLKVVDKASTSEVLGYVETLQEAVLVSEEDLPAMYDLLEESGTPLFSKFSKFLDSKCEQNETFKYWCNYCDMVEILLDCIKAERDGNWNLHLRTVEKMIPYMLIYNHINYVRGCVFYLSDMRKLPTELINAFEQGQFSVKRKSGKFNSVATDHALEQSLIRSSKVQGGLIGMTSNQNAMQKWCLLYHFKTGICQVLQEFCDTNQDPTNDIDEHSHKEWRSKRIERDENDVQLIINFINDHDNPFENSKMELRNIVSGSIATGEASKFLVNIKENGTKTYDRFVKDRSVDQIKGIYSPIEKVSVLYMSSLPQETTKELKKKKKCATTNVSSTVMLATQRNVDLETLLKHELLDYPPSLANESGHLKKSVKSELMNIIESDTTCSKTLHDLGGVDQVHIVDGMAFIHSVPGNVLVGLKTFQDFAEYQLKKVECLLQKNNSVRVDVVYDSYGNIDCSIKNAELNLRSKGKAPLIVNIHNDLTKFPKQWPRYLSVPENKKNLIKYVTNFIIKRINVPAGKSIYFAGSLDKENECHMKDDLQVISECLDLKSNQTEADTRIYLHAKHAVANSTKGGVEANLFIHSPDTDVFVLGVSLWTDFKSIGCKSMWFITGVGDRKRALGCHLASEALGSNTSSILPALHVFTGCDSTSKVGTKKYSFNLLKKSETIINTLELLYDSNLTHEQLIQLEGLYLKIVKKKGSSCNESRHLHFLSNPSALNDISSLPCTSDSFEQHVLRCSAQLYYWKNSTTAFVEPLDLTNYGFYHDDSSNLRPRFMTLPPLPENLIDPCKCKNCSKTSCACFKHKLSCCTYCVCKEKCKNVYTIRCEEDDE